MGTQVLDVMARQDFEELIAIQDRPSGLRAFLGIHSTRRGPAFGGIRRFAYRDERSALHDCLRLALSMAYKCALAGIPGGGAKLVILDGPELDRPAAYRHLGERIERLAGRYYAGPDVGTGLDELESVAEKTGFVTPPGENGPGDLAGATAAGVFAGIRAALIALDGEEAWPTRTVVIQGLGSVGWCLAERLRSLEVRVLAAEIEAERAHRAFMDLGVEILDQGTELEVEADVFAPCALGGILHDLTIQRLRARIVCGAANNPLAKTEHGDRLFERDVLYVPDFVVNSGAVMRGAEYHLYGNPTTLEEIEDRIGIVASDVLNRACKERRPPARVAQDEAERRLALGSEDAAQPEGSAT